MPENDADRTERRERVRALRGPPGAATPAESPGRGGPGGSEGPRV